MGSRNRIRDYIESLFNFSHNQINCITRRLNAPYTPQLPFYRHAMRGAFLLQCRSALYLTPVTPPSFEYHKYYLNEKVTQNITIWSYIILLPDPSKVRPTAVSEYPLTTKEVFAIFHPFSSNIMNSGFDGRNQAEFCEKLHYASNSRLL